MEANAAAHMNRLDAALWYARRGWHVFPIEPAIVGDRESGKRPVGQLVPKGKDDATTDEATIRRWWVHGDWNIGISTAPSRLVVLDTDVSIGTDGKQKQGAASRQKLNEHIPPTLCARTGSGGTHELFACPPDFPPTSRIGFEDGLDLIGNGYIVAPPSTHWSGKDYTWYSDPTLEPARLPDYLRTVRKQAPGRVTQATAGEVAIIEGGRDNALFKLGCALRKQGIQHDALRAALHLENRRRCQPPMTDPEVERIAWSVMKQARVERDAALAAVVEADVLDALGVPQKPSMWAHEVADLKTPPTRYYSTGNAQLDRMLGGGLATRQVHGVVAPPSVGKSAFVGSVAYELQALIPGLHVSSELTRYELMIRYASMLLGVTWREAMRGQFDQAQLKQALLGLRIKLVGCDELDLVDPIGQIYRLASELHQECGGDPPFIVIDYVQLLVTGAEDGARARIGDITKRLRVLSQRLDCPILAVFSTGRQFYGPGRLEQLRELDDPTVYLGAAKECGDIEFHCAVLMFLDVDQLADKPEKPARAVVARCRMGEIGAAGYRAHLASGRWIEDPFVTASTMGADRRAKREAEAELIQITEQTKKAAEYETKILEAIKVLPGHTWTDQRAHSGIKNGAEEVRNRLLARGMIELRPYNHRASSQSAYWPAGHPGVT